MDAVQFDYLMQFLTAFVFMFFFFFGLKTGFQK